MNNKVLNLASDRASESERVYYEAWREWKLKSGDDITQVTSEAEMISWLIDAGRIYKLYIEYQLACERPLLAALTTSVNVVTPKEERTLYCDRAIFAHIRVRGIKYEYQTSKKVCLYPPVPERYVQDQLKLFLKFTEWGLAGFILRGEVPVADG